MSGALQANYHLTPGSSTRQSYATVNNGPVQITNLNGNSMIAAERVIYKVKGVNTSFTEMMGLPDSQLDTTYWLPWYNNVDLDTQLRFANVSTQPATVHVYIGGDEMQGSPFTLLQAQARGKASPGSTMDRWRSPATRTSSPPSA